MSQTCRLISSRPLPEESRALNMYNGRLSQRPPLPLNSAGSSEGASAGMALNMELRQWQQQHPRRRHVLVLAGRFGSWLLPADAGLLPLP